MPIASCRTFATGAKLFEGVKGESIVIEITPSKGGDAVKREVLLDGSQPVVKIPVGETVEFGSLQITARYCDKRPPTEPPESAAFLEVVEVKPGEPAIPRFSGWMFASSPALSSMDHPVYDLWVIDCTNESSTEPGTSQ